VAHRQFELKLDQVQWLTIQTNGTIQIYGTFPTSAVVVTATATDILSLDG
jgi:hypothetical protein